MSHSGYAGPWACMAYMFKEVFTLTLRKSNCIQSIKINGNKCNNNDDNQQVGSDTRSTSRQAS